MNSRRGAIEYRRLRAPRNHGERLIQPPLADAAALLTENLGRSGADDVECCGRSLRELTSIARQHLVAAGNEYTRAYRDVAERSEPVGILMTGHQPALYHPGVWIKNFVLSSLADRLNCVAVHVLIDNDDAGTLGIRVPAGSLTSPRAEVIHYGTIVDPVAFEETTFRDRDLFRSFAPRVAEAIKPFVHEPLVEQLWPAAVEAADTTNNLPESVAIARHRLEESWGLNTLELPLSHICDSEPFRWFACHLLTHAERFRTIHNQLLDEYRRVNRIRSNTHPVPPLADNGDWIEVPFWIWTIDHPQRRRLFARRVSDAIELTDRQHFDVRLALTDDTAQIAVDQLDELARTGVRLRSRALTTTLYLRLVLSDLFVHGIGGAKYDQLTDVIAERFLGVKLPDFLTVTATALLPVQRPDVTTTDLRQIDFMLRELHFNPQRHVAPTTQTAALVGLKQRWIDAQPQPEERRERHVQLHAANEQLWQHGAQQVAALMQQRERVLTDLRINRLLASREYSFCLFPESNLRPLLLDK